MPLTRDGVVAVAHLGLEDAEHRVVLQQVGEGLGIGNVVDGDDFDPRVLQGRAQEVPANAPETIDSNLNRHNCYLQYISMELT